MNTAYILYNTRAGGRDDHKLAQTLEVLLDDPVKLIDIANISDYRTFLLGLEPTDYIVLCGGDGTLNRFINSTAGIPYTGEILCFPIGTGNDFAKELGFEKGCRPFPVTQYLKDLPTVEIGGKVYRFLNGVGFGIDGYCCQVGDEKKAKGAQKVNYTAIAIGGLLFSYRPTGARVTVDGVTHTYKKVWLAPTMYGKFYGGGMIPTPAQARGSDKLSVMVYHGTGKLKTLAVFPSIFKGAHVKHTNMVAVHSGREITVEFDSPRALQIDGETILGVTAYTAKSACRQPEAAACAAAVGSAC